MQLLPTGHLIFKAVKGMLSEYLSDLFVVRNNVNCQSVEFFTR